MAAAGRINRERAGATLCVQDWTDWEKVLVPTRERGFKRRHRDHFGYRKVNVTIPITNCGVYEWRVEKEEEDVDYVVYVGKSCGHIPFLGETIFCREANAGGMCRRHACYFRSGSHLYDAFDEKKDFFNTVLKNGGSMWLRVTNAGNNTEAERIESTLLQHYDYAWNMRSNGRRRYILPNGWNSRRTHREEVVEEDTEGWSSWERVQWPVTRDNVNVLRNVAYGIYEWKISKRGMQGKTVYVSQGLVGLPSARFENARFNDANVWLRVKNANDAEEKQDYFADCLRRYDYAWKNQGNNNAIRNIFRWD